MSSLRLGQARPALRARDSRCDRADPWLGVRRLRERGVGALPRRSARVLASRALTARGRRQGVGREGTGVRRPRRRRRGPVADREVPLRRRARSGSRRAWLDNALRRGRAARGGANPRPPAPASRAGARPRGRDARRVSLGDRLPAVRARRGHGRLDVQPPSLHRDRTRPRGAHRDGSRGGAEPGLRPRLERLGARFRLDPDSPSRTFSNACSARSV